MGEGVSTATRRQTEYAAADTVQIFVPVRLLRRLHDVHGVESHRRALEVEHVDLARLSLHRLLDAVLAFVHEARRLLLHLKRGKHCVYVFSMYMSNNRKPTTIT